MKQTAYQLVFDGLTDRETPYALCEINSSDHFKVVTVGLSSDSIVTMGGLQITPEITINDVSPTEASMFILPGGDLWERQSCPEVINLLHRLHAQNVPLAAICGATLEFARAGLLHNVRHTSNSKAYLKAKVPDYRDEAFFVDELVVTDNNIITASGLGSIEFGREVIKLLNLFGEAEMKEWFEMYKHGVIPAKYKSA
jgi:putative intracellular protease/amidase